MNKYVFAGLSVTLLLCVNSAAFAQEWSAEQQEVIEFEEACINARDANTLKACFHDNYVGWGMNSTVPLSKNDILKIIDDDYATRESESLMFKPMSVIVKGNMAVVSYVDAVKITNKITEDVQYYTQRWTDVCIKDGGKWYWISDHGVNISSD